MSTHSSSAKNWGWAVARRRCLNMAHPGCNIRCQGVPNRLALLLHSCFIEASPTVEKAVTCYEVNRLVASLPQHSVVICSTQSLCCRGSTLRMRPQTGVCEPEQSQQCELSGPTFRFTMQGFSMVGGYLKDFEKPQNCQNWGVGACMGMGTCPDSTLCGIHLWPSHTVTAVHPVHPEVLYTAWSSLGGVKRASGSGHSETSLQIGLNHCQVRLLTVSCVLSNQESGKLIFSAKFVGLSSPQ